MSRSPIIRVTVIVPAYKAGETLADCLRAITGSTRKPDEVIVFHDGLTTNVEQIVQSFGAKLIPNPGARMGAPAARNAGARKADCDVLMFVDADVVVASNAFELLLNEIESDPQIWAAFGSYDQTPRVTRNTALYANLRHHCVHQRGDREAVTFWTGIGAVRRDAFWSIGGFDILSGVDDIDLGARLKSAGGRVRLVPEALGTHCKNWQLRQLWYTDLVYRAIPWAKLLASGRCRGGHLNAARREQRSAATAYLCLATLIGCVITPWAALAFAIFTGGYIWLNLALFRLLLWRGGMAALITGIALHWLYHLYASATYILVLTGTKLRTRVEPRP